MSRLSTWLTGKSRPTRGEVFAALDIGTSKIVCFIARADDAGHPRVIGIGHHVSEGMRGGLVANMDIMQRAVTSAVATAEQMAGETIERVIVNVAGPLLHSQTAPIVLPLNGREMSLNDQERLLSQGQTLMTEDPQGKTPELIHAFPVSYSLDGQRGIRDPLGMIGNELQAQMHLVTAAFGPARTLITAVARCHLDVDRLIAAPYASGLSCLVEDEMDLGATVLDMGAGTTSMGIFFDGHLIHADGIPVGGAHITSDIARGLTTNLANAERLKTLYGSALLAPTDERDLIDVPQIGEEEQEQANHVPKAHMIRIIQPRLEEIFEMIRTKLENSGLNETAGKRVVLTGGASQLSGIREIAQRILDKQVRLGRPLRIARPYLPSTRSGPSVFSGLAEATSGPAFATIAGLLAVAVNPDLASNQPSMDNSDAAFFSRMGQWVRQNL